jgi:triosephosphate isomerase (TIM)
VSHRIPIFVANWKMNKLVRELPEYVTRLKGLLGEGPLTLGIDFEVVIAPSSAHLTALGKCLEGTGLRAGAQNSGAAKFGAYTGEVSPSVIKELGAEWVILGHSERRHVFKEEDLLILSRVRAALEEGLSVLLCVGEVLQDRKAGKTFKTIETQLSILKQALPQGSFQRMMIAYEPVWAIGTGENATPQQAEEVHAFIRNWFSEKCSADEAGRLKILYGGSVKPENSAQIMGQKDVDGLLVGGASLDPVTFASVIRNGLKSRT